MNEDQLARKAIYMRRDYSDKEISELLGVKLEDLKAAIENHLHPPDFKSVVQETKTVQRKGRRKKIDST